jgi:hypothetical protein
MSNRILRLAGLLVDNLVRGAPERLLRIAVRSVVTHHDLCRPHLSDLPQELQAMIARQQHRGLPLSQSKCRVRQLMGASGGSGRRQTRGRRERLL